MSSFVYRGAHTREISFPLGGLGTGCLGLAGNGRLIDWEIFNRPNKGGLNGCSHFALKAEHAGRVLDARVLHGDLLPPYSGGASGPAREFLTGLPHFREVAFRGTFPVARLTYRDRQDPFPARVRLTAFNPFIPLNARDSGLPAAFFEFEITNTSRQALTYTLAGVLANPLAKDARNQVVREDGLSLLHLDSTAFAGDAVEFGNLALATCARDTSHQTYWFRGRWFDDLEIYWRDFTAPGRFKDRQYPVPGWKGHGVLAAHVHLAPGARANVRFVIAWHFPNCEAYWRKDSREAARKAGVPPVWRNWYATQWADSRASAAYALRNWDRLWSETHAFERALFSSTLPAPVLEAVSANLSILKSPTVLRLEDGTFYGWEGCHDKAGCCEGSCTHVWNYAQALPFLFPDLERTMREADFRYNLREDGGMPFRLQLPLGLPRSGFRPCADGQLGGVLKVYRDWKLSGDTDWLRQLWPAVRRSLEFAWHPGNQDRWDPARTGVLWGRQHHTLDMELFGPNAWLTGFYLGALKAAADMATHLGEAHAAQEYLAMFKKGRAWTERHLFNGRYYFQRLNLRDKALLAQFQSGGECLGGQDVHQGYWDQEHGEIKYQVGEGCLADQLLAQWHAHLYGLGDLFEPGHAKQAAQAIFRQNFKPSLRRYANPCRVYGLNDEAGLVICDWPRGARRPAIPVPYATETMHGFEYAAAGLMMQYGLVREGLRVVKAVRDRYDGQRRNPWNEIECGHNYARSMASYALLPILSGFQADLVSGRLAFAPLVKPKRVFRCFWSVGTGWGQASLSARGLQLAVQRGKLALRRLELPFLGQRRARKVMLDRQAVSFIQADRGLHFPEGLTVCAGNVLRVRWA